MREHLHVNYYSDFMHSYCKKISKLSEDLEFSCKGYSIICKGTLILVNSKVQHTITHHRDSQAQVRRPLV